MKINYRGFSTVSVVILTLVIAIIGAIGWYVAKAPAETATDRPAQTASIAPAPPAPVTTGTIKGSASFPSSRLPEDLSICAENLERTTDKPICVNVGEKQTIQYELIVPAGGYYVYAQTARNPGYKAYYNVFVTCGLSVDCSTEGHKQYLPVKVEAGATKNNIDPGDWYDS